MRSIAGPGRLVLRGCGFRNGRHTGGVHPGRSNLASTTHERTKPAKLHGFRLNEGLCKPAAHDHDRAMDVLVPAPMLGGHAREHVKSKLVRLQTRICTQIQLVKCGATRRTGVPRLRCRQVTPPRQFWTIATRLKNAYGGQGMPLPSATLLPPHQLTLRGGVCKMATNV